MNELQKKYPSGAIITDSPFNPKVLRGKTMTGNLILKIPEQREPIPQSVIDYANNKGIIISVCSLSNLFFQLHKTTLAEVCSNESKQHHL